MKLLMLFAGLLLATLSARAAPMPVKASDHVEIHNEKAQTIMHGKDKVKNIKAAAVDSNFQIEQSIRVATFPENPENHDILVQSFNTDFMAQLAVIQQTLASMRNGKLQVGKVNADADSMGNAVAAVDPSTKVASFGPKFHSKSKTDESRAGTFTHEKSHAFANTKDYFAKADGRPLGTSEAKGVDHFVGYIHKDHALLPSHSSVRNADSYLKLGQLAVAQYKAHKGKPPAKK